MTERNPSGPRCAALVGPYLSGKTTLLENILFVTGAINRRGTIKEGNTVGDSSPESRQRQMSVEITAATTEFLGETWTFLDCPGSIELQQDTYNALLVADVAVIVVEPVADRARALAPILKFLDDREIPHMIFVNKMDHPTSTVREVMSASIPQTSFKSTPRDWTRFLRSRSVVSSLYSRVVSPISWPSTRTRWAS